MAIKIITPPGSEPVTLQEAKLHLRVDGDDEDTLIMGLIQAAREHVENVLTHTSLCTQTLEYVISQFPDFALPTGKPIFLPRPPLQSVTSIIYTDIAGVPHTMSAADYVVNADENPGIIVPAYGKTWPAAVVSPTGGIRIRYVAGWGLPATVPQSLKQAILLLVGHFYDNRGVMVQSALAEMPMAVTALCNSYICYQWGMED